MNRQTPLNTIPLLILLLLCSIYPCVLVTYATPPKYTPGELLIRLTPEASAALVGVNSKSKIREFFKENKVISYKPIFFSPDVSQVNSSKLQRTYLLRFSTLTNLPHVKKALENSTQIEEVSFNYLRPTLAETTVPNDPKYGEQWSLPAMKVPQAWTIEKGKKEVVIAIVDSGIDYRHDDLANKIWINQNEIPDNEIDDDENGYIDDVHGWDFTDAPNLQGEGDFVEGDNEPIDESGHGTHVAGIAGAMPNNSTGIAGVAWHCSLMAVRAGLSLGGGSRMQDDDSAAAIVYAADNGANIINMSWGSKQQSFVIRDAIEYAHARGVVLIAAAGNANEAESIFPAAYRRVISVASTNQHQQRFYRSNYGASVDIGAPGNGIISTQIDNDYRILTGTSMAAPHVAGVAALMLSKRPALTQEEVRQILINTADPVSDAESDEPDIKFVGAGTVNAEKALLASSVLQARIISPQTNSGGSFSITFSGTAGGYKFKSWQLVYGNSTAPTTFIPITEEVTIQKTSEQLSVWNTTDIPEGIYTIRLIVYGRDGYQTHDQVVLTIDRSPPKISSVTAKESLYKDELNTIISWVTDDVTQGTLFYRRNGQVVRFASIEESGLGKEHFFSLGLESGKYQFYIEAQNTVGLKSVDDNSGKYYDIEVVDRSISPHGFAQTNLISTPLIIANVSTDFDKDGFYELIGTSLSDTSDSELTAEIPVIYERSPTGKYNQVFSFTDINTSSTSANGVDFSTLVPVNIDDTDNDGLLEILVYDKKRTYLIESVTADGYPTNIIWETPYLSGGIISDFDGDGKKEIVGTDNNNNRILVFENIGNNQYIRTAELSNETDGKNIYSNELIIDDINHDGVLDLFIGDSEGEFFIYNAIGDDQFRLSWQSKIEVDEVLHLSSGDLNGDGRSEFVVGGIASLPDVPSIPPFWKFQVFSYESGNYEVIWEQTISTYRIFGNSVKVVELDNDNLNELVIIANPNLYVLKWNGTAFLPMYYAEVGETPTLFSADLNNNGFNEILVNTDDGLNMIESVFATDSNTVAHLIPWNVTASPISSKTVEITWDTPDQLNSNSVYTVYRAVGTKNDAPVDSQYEKIALDLTTAEYSDINVETDKTYWYAISAMDETGNETARSRPDSATPRLVPRILSTTFQHPNWVIIRFDRQMSSSISNEQRYLFRIPNELSGIKPSSAVRDRMGTRVLLGFDSESLQTLIDRHTDEYEIVVTNVVDIDENTIYSASSLLKINRNTVENKLDDLAQLRVYPNPVRPSLSDIGAITFEGVPIGTSIKLFTQKGELLENLNVTEGDGYSKKWWLTNDSIGDIATGIYIYMLEYETQRKIGKIAVIK